MRPIERVVIHCAYTPPTLDIGVREIDRWHRDRGWSGIGYHFVIRRSGYVESGRPVEAKGAHAKGFNETSIGICLIGGKVEGQDKSDCNYTIRQWTALRRITSKLIEKHPNASVVGHRDLDPHKDCPVFDVEAWWGD